MLPVWPDRSFRTCLAVAALAPLLLAASGAAEGATPPVRVAIEQPAAGERLLAGSTTAVRWTQLPAEVEEFELLLTLDGARSFTVRLTPQSDPTSEELSWEVPNLPAREARLRLRVGIGGQEIESEPSAPFAIVGSYDAPTTPLYFADGELWTFPVPVPPIAELLVRQAGLHPPAPDRPELVLALLPDETHLLTLAPTIVPLGLPAAPVDRPAPIAWSDPSRPIVPNQRE